MARILVIDDDQSIASLVQKTIARKGHDVVTAFSGGEGLEAVEADHFDLVVTDLVMPEVDGMGVLSFLQEKQGDTLCIIMTGKGSIKSAVEAMKKGAFDYITKPASVEEIQIVVEKALSFKNLKDENIRLANEVRSLYDTSQIIGTSRAITDIYRIIERVADTDGTILITGDSGTGKELIAKAIHNNSSRSNRPMVVINCGAIPEELLESELFGHEKGAFTGAHKTRTGRFEMANGGTVFLDEIGEMSPALQVKLLRVLQEQKFEKVGGTRTVHIDVRFIAATNKNLRDAIKKGSFREDLFYRLNVIPIRVPPLKDRRSDIQLLVDHFLTKFQKNGRRIKGVAKDAMDAMTVYDWPGNVRELQNVIKRNTILCEGDTITLADLPETIRRTRFEDPRNEVNTAVLEKFSFYDAVQNYEKQLILQALQQSDWVKSKAAKMLDMNRTTLVEKIKKQNLEMPAIRETGTE